MKITVTVELEAIFRCGGAIPKTVVHYSDLEADILKAAAHSVLNAMKEAEAVGFQHEMDDEELKFTITGIEANRTDQATLPIPEDEE